MVQKTKNIRFTRPVRKRVDENKQVCSFSITNRMSGKQWSALKEKLLAAHRGGITTVLIPKENEKDLVEIPDNVKKGLKIIAASTVDEVLSEALSREPVPIDLEEDEDDIVSGADGDKDTEGVVTH